MLKQHDQELDTADKQAYVQQKCEERAYEIGQYARVAAALGQVPTTEEAIFIQAAWLKLEELRVHQPDMPADLVEVLRNRPAIDTKTLEQVSLEQPYLLENLLGELKRVEPDIEAYREMDNKQKLMIEAGEQALIKAYMDGSFIPLRAASQGEHSNDPMASEIRKHLGALGLLGKSVRELFEYRWEDHRNNKTAT